MTLRHGMWIVVPALLLFGCEALLNTRKPIGTCGDHVQQSIEECDDGNTDSGDGCSDQCKKEECGNGRMDFGEDCDDSNTLPGDGCSPLCTEERCGNLIEDPGEECDDGNAAPGDGCSPLCTEEVCGNGIEDPDDECDDGPNNDNGGECTLKCKIRGCGDGLLKTRGKPNYLEVCDDGNQTNGDGCNPDCSLRGRVRVIGGAPGGRGVADGIGSVARFGGVTGLAADAQGEYLYVGDEEACAIRRLHIATGTVDTVAGQTGRCGLNRLTGGAGDQAIFAAVPKRLAVVADALFVTEGNRLRRVDLSSATHRVSTCDPLGLGGADNPSTDPTSAIQALAADPDDSGLYLATYHAIYRMPLPCTCDDEATPAAPCRATLLAGSVAPSSIAREGAGADARFAGILALARHPSKRQLVLSDLIMIRTLDLDTQWVDIVAGGEEPDHVDGQGRAARFYFIRSLAFDGGLLYAVEQSAERVSGQNRFRNWGWANVRLIDSTNWQVSTVAGTFGSAPSGRTPETNGFGPHARFVEAEAVAIAQDTLFIGGGASVRAMSLDSRQVLTAAGQLVGDFTYYRSRAIASVNGSLYTVGRDGNLHVIPVAQSGPVRKIGLCPSSAGVSPIVRAMTAVDCERDDDRRCPDGSDVGGRIFVADDAIAGICQIDLAGKRGAPCCRGCTETCQQIFTTGPFDADDLGQFWHWGVNGLTTDGTHLYLLAQATKQLIRVTPSPTAGTPLDTYEAIDTPVQFLRPWDIAYAEPFVYVSDQQANAIFRIDPTTGAFATIGNGDGKTTDGNGDGKTTDGNGDGKTTDGRGVAASFCHPVGLVATGDSLFVGEAFCNVDRRDWNGHAVRQIDLTTHTVSTLLGPGPEPFVLPGTGRQAGVNWPTSLTFDPVTGALYAADLWDHVLLEID